MATRIGRGSSRITGGINPQGKKVSQVYVAFDEEYIGKLIRELKKMNVHLSLMTDTIIENEDVEI